MLYPIAATRIIAIGGQYRGADNVTPRRDRDSSPHDESKVTAHAATAIAGPRSVPASG